MQTLYLDNNGKIMGEWIIQPGRFDHPNQMDDGAIFKNIKSQTNKQVF